MCASHSWCCGMAGPLLLRLHCHRLYWRRLLCLLLRAPLAAEILASQLADEPLPVATDLAAALHPGRWWIRQIIKGALACARNAECSTTGCQQSGRSNKTAGYFAWTIERKNTSGWCTPS